MNKDNSDLELDDENQSDELKDFSSERLSDIVITYRYIGLNKEMSIAAMEELSARRIAGNDFAYEAYIEKNLKELPSLKFDIKSVDGLISKLRGMKNVK